MRLSPQDTPIPSPRRLELIDNPFAPNLFATAASGCSIVQGVVMLTLESTRCDHSHNPPQLERVVVGRVTLTTAAAQSLVAQLNDFLERQGLSPSRAFAGGATRQ